MIWSDQKKARDSDFQSISWVPMSGYLTRSMIALANSVRAELMKFAALPAGFMNNEFQGTSGWACPCSVQPGGCSNPTCTLTGAEVVASYELFQRNKCVTSFPQQGAVEGYSQIASWNTCLSSPAICVEGYSQIAPWYTLLTQGPTSSRASLHQTW